MLVGHCLDFGDGSPPYLPFSEALGRLAADSPAEAESLLAASPAIARLLPAQRLLAESDHAMEPTGRTTLYDALHAALSRLSADTPLLLIIEDVHWADQSTRDLLRFLFARQFTSPTCDPRDLPHRRSAPSPPAARGPRRVDAPTGACRACSSGR